MRDLQAAVYAVTATGAIPSLPHDHAEITSFLANRVVLEALSGTARRRDARDGTTWDRRQPLLGNR